MTEPSAAPTPPPRPIFHLPAEFARRVSDFFTGEREPAAPRDSASVLLLRPGQGPGDEAGLEVYLLRRARSMAFAAGASAFPGGSVDPRDAEGEIAWAGPDLGEWGRVLDAPPDLARELVCAAVRETFEESGVLLAGPAADSVIADTSGADWEEDRVAMAEHSLSLAEMLGRRQLVLRSDLLHPWARWITPIPEPRRFDTRFFAAALPPGQRARHVGGEADQVAWLSPAEVIRAARAGELNLMPPTASCLAGLLSCGDVSMALHAQRDLRPVLPVIYPADGGYWLAVPADVDYPL